jgi:hypothetical protein
MIGAMSLYESLYKLMYNFLVNNGIWIKNNEIGYINTTKEQDLCVVFKKGVILTWIT